MRHILLLLLLLAAFCFAPAPAASQGGAPVYVPLVAGPNGPTATSAPTVQPTSTPAPPPDGLIVPTGRFRMPCTVLDQVAPAPEIYNGQILFGAYCTSGLPTGWWLFELVGLEARAISLEVPDTPVLADAGIAPISNYGPARASTLGAGNFTIWSYPSDQGNGRGNVLSIAVKP